MRTRLLSIPAPSLPFFPRRTPPHHQTARHTPPLFCSENGVARERALGQAWKKCTNTASSTRPKPPSASGERHLCLSLRNQRVSIGSRRRAEPVANQREESEVFVSLLARCRVLLPSFRPPIASLLAMATKRLREEDESTDGDAPTVMPPKAKRQKGIAAAAAASHVVLSRCRQSLTRCCLAPCSSCSAAV